DGRFPLRERTDRLAIPAGLSPRSADLEEAPHAEERRLFYVALTRAKDELHLSWARATASGRTNRPSPFIAEALDRVASASAGNDAQAPTGAAALVAAIAAGVAPQPVTPAARASRQITGPINLSFSQIDDYLSCPLKYRLRHVVRVPTPPHHALILGSAMHQAAAAFHNAEIRGRELSAEELLEVFDTHWSGEGFLSRHHEEARYAAGREALLHFREERLASAEPAPAAVERPFSVTIDGDVVRGRYDRVDHSADGVVITDYKSSDVRDPVKAAQKARDSLQLQVYALAHEAETGRLPAAVQLHFMESGVVGRAVPDPKRLEKARAKIRQAGDGIRARAFDARPDHISCGYCPFREICPSSAA
ncbi:MAG: PD-(D/E)XK nuclease family protein, partial [Candidatus Limnocylindrales bacterium]